MRPRAPLDRLQGHPDPRGALRRAPRHDPERRGTGRRRRAPRHRRVRDGLDPAPPERGVHPEAGALVACDVVDLRAVDERQALGIDQEPYLVVLVDLVALALGVEGERVLEARAAAAPNRHAQPGLAGLRLAVNELFY